VKGLHAVVLAAGSAARFGGGKLTAPYRGRTLVEAAVEAALAAPVEAAVLVVGADAQAVAAAATRAGDARLHVVEAADHAEGMAASLRAGIAALPPDAEGVLVFLGDMPEVPSSVLAPLARALAGGAPAAAPVHAGRRGHPAAFSRSLFPVLLALTGDRGARGLLDGLGPALVEVATDDPGVLTDVDTKGDLARLTAQAPGREPRAPGQE
jgi:molybdenum cofactor cytidylyltransferase